MVDVRGKKILFIGIGFYDYERVIKNCLEDRGAEVFYFSSDIAYFGNGPLHRIGLHTLAIKFAGSKLQTLLEEQPSNIDFVFIIKALNFQKQHFEYIKARYPKTPIVIYLWDSLNRLYNKDVILSATNRILTFDREDAVNCNLVHRPLFARSVCMNYNNKPKYDIAFIGLDHSIRYDVIKKLRKQMDDNGIKYKIVLTTKSLFKFIGIYLTHRISKKDVDLFQTKPLPYSEYLKILNDTNVVLDISHPKQTGLTMRTIETLAMGKRIITTNNDISHYNIPHEIYRVIDSKYPILDFDFIKNNDYNVIDVSIFTLSKFIDDILSH